MKDSESSMNAAPLPDEWRPVCRLDEIADNGALVVAVEPPVAVYRVGDAVFATADTCTHATFSLADGYVDEDCTVECELHGAIFCLKTGKVLRGPASVDLATYPVKVEKNVVYVNIAPCVNGDPY
jgi:3-phenylpropionate/trans-cinnamate dioxygenase ferredoxin component